MREEQKSYIRKLYRQIKGAEEQMRDKPMPTLTKEDFFLFQETGNRLVYESAYFGRRKYLTVYAILSLWSRELAEQGVIDNDMDGNREGATEDDYIRHLEKILINICEEQFWALPAHVDFGQIDQPGTRFTIDLFAAETAQALSEIVLRLYDRLSYEVVAGVARAVTERVLQPFVSSEVPYSWWETDRCNWSAVCAGSVGMAAINIDRLNHKILSDYVSNTADHRGNGVVAGLEALPYCDCFEQLPSDWKENCLRRACDALQCYLDGMEDDGACTEGLGYYNYGMSFYAAFAEAYSADSGQEPDQLMYRDKCRQIAMFQQKCYFACCVGNGVSISFSDGGKHESFLPGLTAYLKHCYPQVQTPDYNLARPFDEDACYRYLTNERNISWLMKYADEDAGCARGRKQDKETGTRAVEQSADALEAYLLPAAQWLICQDRNGNGFAAKGGNNDENHNHNDIGHFLCVFNGEMLLTDLGAGEYTKEYFSDRRYDILCNRSFGHSVPVINGMEQCAGKEYRADSFVWDEDMHMLTMEIARAYRRDSIQSIVRHIRMIAEQQGIEGENTQGTAGTEPAGKMQIVVEDLFTANENTRSVAENLITEYEPVLRDGMVWIEGQNGSCRIDVEDAGSRVQILPCDHSDHAGNHRTVYRILWDIDVKKCSTASCKMWITFYDKVVNS